MPRTFQDGLAEVDRYDPSLRTSVVRVSDIARFAVEPKQFLLIESINFRNCGMKRGITSMRKSITCDMEFHNVHLLFHGRPESMGNNAVCLSIPFAHKHIGTLESVDSSRGPSVIPLN